MSKKIQRFGKVFTLLLVGFLAGIVISNSNSPKDTQPVTNETSDIYTVWQLTNAERAKVGVPALALDKRLNQSAQLKADELVRTNHFEHVAPDGKQGYTYIDDMGVACQWRSENLAMHDPTPVDGWMNSPSHRRALLDPQYDLVGFGMAGVYYVQHFCNLP